MPCLRIAEVLSSFHTGGAERVALLLADRLVRRGHAVTVISLEEFPAGPLASEFEAAGVRVLTQPKRQHGVDPHLPLELFKLLRSERFDVVHTHNPLPLIYAALPGRLSGARVVHTKHGAHPAPFKPLMLRRIGAASAHAFVAVSEATAAYSQELYEVAPWKLKVVLNGTDLERFRPDPAARRETRRTLGIPEDAYVFGTVGRLAAVKNQALLIRAAAPLLSPRVRLLIVGHGAELERLRAVVAEHSVTAFVHFAGETPRVAEHLAAFDLFALSSDSEGMPLSLTEAMGVALPMVSTSVGGVPKLIDDGETGLLVPAGDEGALRGALARLLEDRELGRLMGRRGREVAEARYSVEHMVDAYLKLYRG